LKILHGGVAAAAAEYHRIPETSVTRNRVSEGTMKAIRVHQTGGPEVLTLEEIAVPEPKAGEVRVRVRAAGLNFIDIYHRIGLYPMPLPFTPGQEGAGEVEVVGEGVGGFRPGDRVAWASVIGSYAHSAVVPAKMLVRIPDGVSFELAAATMLQGMTAHYLAHSLSGGLRAPVAGVWGGGGGGGGCWCRSRRCAARS
jgi:NADPH2:quinone reductase